MANTLTEDPTVNAVLEKMIKRAETGMKKYGKSIRDDNRRDLVGWISEAQEELYDAIIYLEKVKEVFKTSKIYTKMPYCETNYMDNSINETRT